MAINRDVRVDYVGTDRTRTAAQSAAQGVRRVRLEVDRLTTRYVAAQRTFSTLTLGFAGVNSVRTLATLQESLLRVKNLSLDYARDQQFLSKTTRALNLDLQNAASAFSDILVLQSTGYLNDGQAQDLFIGFQETAKKFGIGANDIKFALRGLRQALTAGVVRAQEFDQIFDAIGAVTPLVAKNLGITTKELLKLRTSASLSSEALLNALIPALREADGSAALASKNINASLLNISNAYKEALLEFEEPIGGGIQAFSNAAVAAIDGIVENADKIKLVGIAIAAAYGGRAIASVAALTAAKSQSVAVSVAQTRALVINNGLLAQEAALELQIARQEQQSLISQRAALQLDYAQANSTAARLAIQTQLTAARGREVAGLSVLQAANARATSTTLALTNAQRAATVSSVALTGAMTGLNSVMSLFGGPLGAGTVALGTLAYLGLRQSELQKTTVGVVEATKELNAEYAKSGDKALIDAQSRRDSLQLEIDNLIDQRQKFADGSYRRPIFGTIDEDAAVDNLTRKIEFLRDKLKQLSIKEDLIKDARATSDEFEALGNTVLDVVGNVDSAGNLIDKFLPSRKKLKELKDAMAEARAAFSEDSSDGKAVVSAIQAEIDKLDPALKKREEYQRTIDKARESLSKLNSELATERQRIQDTFANAEQTVLLNLEIDPNFSEVDAQNVIAKARERMSAQLQELDNKDAEQARKVLQEKQAARDKDIASFQSYQDRLISARQVVNPIAGETDRFRTEILRLVQENNDGLIKSDQDYYLLAQSAYRQHVDTLKSIGGEEQEIWSDLSFARKESLIASTTSTFLDAFKKDVGGYITLNDNMTAAEKENAEASNRINKKRFEANKKINIAQALISTYTGAANAFRDVPYPFNFVAAGAITAAGLRMVQNIRSSSFGGSVGSGGAANYSSATSGAVETERQEKPIQERLVIIMGNYSSEQEALERAGVAQKKLYEQGYIFNNEDGTPNFDNVPDRVINVA